MEYIQTPNGAVEIKTYNGAQYAFGVSVPNPGTVAEILRSSGYKIIQYVKIQGRQGWKVEKTQTHYRLAA